MSSSGYKIRRVHVADLNELRSVWRAAGIYSLELEKRFTEFQIVIDREAAIVASFGVDVRGKEGHIHSVAFRANTPKEELLEVIWNRAQTLAENHGLLRLWSPDEPFWSGVGFAKPDEKARKQAAELYDATMDRRLMLQLRDEADIQMLAEAQFELFQQSTVAERERILERGKVYRNAAIAFALLVVIGGLIAAGLFVAANR